MESRVGISKSAEPGAVVHHLLPQAGLAWVLQERIWVHMDAYGVILICMHLCRLTLIYFDAHRMARDTLIYTHIYIYIYIKILLGTVPWWWLLPNRLVWNALWVQANQWSLGQWSIIFCLRMGLHQIWNWYRFGWICRNPYWSPCIYRDGHWVIPMFIDVYQFTCRFMNIYIYIYTHIYLYMFVSVACWPDRLPQW